MQASREERNNDLFERAVLQRMAFGADEKQWSELADAYQPQSLREEREAATIHKNATRLMGLLGG